MTTQHTQGRLKVTRDPMHWDSSTTIEGGLVGVRKPFMPELLVQVGGDADILKAEANARRLVAAWNYVEMLGMSTEELELAEQPIYSRRKLEAERDELLKALKRIEGATMVMYATRSDMLEHCQDIARAAIVKVEGTV